MQPSKESSCHSWGLMRWESTVPWWIWTYKYFYPQLEKHYLDLDIEVSACVQYLTLTYDCLYYKLVSKPLEQDHLENSYICGQWWNISEVIKCSISIILICFYSSSWSAKQYSNFLIDLHQTLWRLLKGQSQVNWASMHVSVVTMT